MRSGKHFYKEEKTILSRDQLFESSVLLCTLRMGVLLCTWFVRIKSNRYQIINETIPHLLKASSNPQKLLDLKSYFNIQQVFFLNWG